MANRRFYQFRLALEPQVSELFMQVSFGSSGAPTLSAANSRGISSIVRNSAGNYTITLSDRYSRFLMLNKIAISSAAQAAPEFRVVSEAVSNATPTIVVQFSAAGVATDPASGEAAKMQIILKNSNA